MGNQKINFNLLNPAFNGLQSHSLPFKIPLTDNNIELLGITDENSYLPTMSFDIESDGLWKFRGTLKINRIGSNYEGVLSSGNGSFVNIIKGKKITEVEGSPLTTSQDDSDVLSYLNSHKGDTYPDADYTAFPVSAPGYIPNKSYRIFNDYDRDTQLFIDDPGNLKPFVFIGKILELIFSKYGYAVLDNCFRTDSKLQGYVLFHCNEITWSTVDSEGWGKWLPDVLISDLLKVLRNRLNVVCYVDDSNKVVSIRQFDTDIVAVYQDDITPMASLENEIETDVNVDFRLTTNDDDSEVRDLINSKDITSVNTTMDLPAASESYPVVYVRARGDYHTSVYNEDSDSWSFQRSGSSFNKAEDISDNQIELNAPMRHLPSGGHAIVVGDPDGVYDVMRRVVPLLEDNELSRLSILQYVGLIYEKYTFGNFLERQYPCGTMHYRDAQGSLLVNHSLVPDDSEYGLRASYWSNTELWYSLRKKIICSMDFTPEFLSRLRFYHKYRILNYDIVFDSISIELDFARQVMTVSEATMYTV